MKKDIENKKKARMVATFTENPPFPREILFEPNNTCNHRCFFCAHSKMTRDSQSMDKKLGERLLKEAFDAGARDIGLFATGEPFVCKNLAWFISKAKEIGYEYVFLDSNGALVVPKVARQVIDAGLDSIKFSINAGTKQTYMKVHGFDDFDKVISNIRWFREYRDMNRLNLRIYASMVITSISRKEVNTLKNLLAPLIDKFFERECSNQGGNMLENNNAEKINKKNLLGSRRKNEIGVKCTEPFNRLTVTSEGFLTGCVVDYSNSLIMADLRKTNILEAWNSTAYRKFRRRHIEKKMEGLICMSCITNRAYPTEPTSSEFYSPYRNKEEIQK